MKSAIQRLNLFIFLCLSVLFSSCEIIDKDEPVPSYVHIDKIMLTTTSAEGSNAHKITDAWVFIDNNFIGAFELPATFPVLFEGTHDIKIRAGIKQNGISATRIEYPMYNFYTSTVNLTKGSITNVFPSVQYFPAIKFPWLEDFESTGFNIAESANSDTSIQATSDPALVFEGTKSGMAILEGTHVLFECKSSSAFNIAKGGAVFLELNYKTNNKFFVGVISNGNQVSSLQINPIEEWNKVYVNLTNEINASSSSSFTIFIGMLKEPEVARPELYLDNIKLVHQ